MFNNACLFLLARHDCKVRKNSKRSQHSSAEDLLQWRCATHKHLLDIPSLDTARCLRKPHCTVEEASPVICNLLYSRAKMLAYCLVTTKYLKYVA